MTDTTNTTTDTTRTLYIGPSAEDVRAMLCAADVEAHKHDDTISVRRCLCSRIRIDDQRDNGAPYVLSHEYGTPLISDLLSALVSAVMERDAWKLVADTRS